MPRAAIAKNSARGVTARRWMTQGMVAKKSDRSMNAARRVIGGDVAKMSDQGLAVAWMRTTPVCEAGEEQVATAYLCTGRHRCRRTVVRSLTEAGGDRNGADGDS